jgi:hypothetical protein
MITLEAVLSIANVLTPPGPGGGAELATIENASAPSIAAPIKDSLLSRLI